MPERPGKLGLPPAPRGVGTVGIGPVSRDQHRGSSAERGYSQAWRRARHGFLAKHPMCEGLPLSGRVGVADTVDHLYPHCGHKALFWRREFWVPCCGLWHSTDKQRIERRGLSAINELALELGRPLLSQAAPELFDEWLPLFEARFGR